MRYLKLYEAYITSDDLEEINDMFKDISDKYNLSRLSKKEWEADVDAGYLIKGLDGDDYIREPLHDVYHNDLVNNNITIIKLCVNIPPDFDSFVNDISVFVNRLKSIGYALYNVYMMDKLEPDRDQEMWGLYICM